MIEISSLAKRIQTGRLPRVVVSPGSSPRTSQGISKGLVSLPLITTGGKEDQASPGAAGWGWKEDPMGPLIPSSLWSRQLLTMTAKDPLVIMQSKWKLKMAQAQDKSRICELRDWVILSKPRKNISIYRLPPQYLRGSSEKEKKRNLKLACILLGHYYSYYWFYNITMSQALFQAFYMH